MVADGQPTKFSGCFAWYIGEVTGGSDAYMMSRRNKLNARAMWEASVLVRMVELSEEGSAAGGNHCVLMRWNVVFTVFLLFIIHVNEKGKTIFPHIYKYFFSKMLNRTHISIFFIVLIV